jgi:CelD/BcsL family acetyltransferase involved in cellulose biosynthesis
MPAEVKLFDTLDAVAADARGRLDRAAQASLFDRLDWFRLTLEHCPPPGRLLVARAQEGESAAWLFLMIEGAQARPLASWYSLRVGLQYYQSDKHDLIDAIAASLRGNGITRIILDPIGTGAPTLRDAFARAGWHARLEDATANWSIRTAGMDFDAYWATRPGRLRSTVKRKAKSAALDIAIIDHFDPTAWDAYEAVYRASWKPEEGSPAFLRALAEQEGAAGMLRLGIARVESRPVAAQFWLVEGNIATIHKLAHVIDADALSPGTLLSAAMFRHVIDRDRPALIDFGTGDDAYKADWMDQRVMLQRLICHDPRTVRGAAGAARATLATLVRRRPSR